MSYYIFIQRPGFRDGSDPEGSIQVEEWLAAIQGIEGVRLAADKDWIARDSKSGLSVSIPGSGSDAEVFYAAKPLAGRFTGEWCRVFSWDPGGRVKICADFDPENPNDVVTAAAISLAKWLKANVEGEGGEIIHSGGPKRKAVTPTRVTSTASVSPELARELSDFAGLTPEESVRLLHCVDRALVRVLRREGIVTTLLGRFKLVDRPERSGVDPRTKRKVTIPAARTVRFFPAKNLPDTLA